MKTLTELSGITIRKAAAAITEARRKLPAPEAAAPPPPPEPPPAPVEAAPAAAGAEAPVDAGAPAAVPVPAPAPVPPRPKGRPPEVPETEAEKAALDAAAAEATGLSGDRLARLRDAVKVAGGRVEDVRLVRVFGPEEPVPGAATLNGFQYVVDLAPSSMRQTTGPEKRDRGGGRGGRGGGGGGAGGGGGKGAPKSSGFSMDALKDDRKGQRGGPGRGRPGGGGSSSGSGKPR